MILNALPKSYSSLVDTLKYGRETLSLEDVQVALKAKELESKPDRKQAAEGLNVQGKSKKSGKSKNKDKAKPKGDSSEPFPYKFYHCHKQGHMKKDCPDRDKTFNKQGNVTVAEQGYDSAEALTISEDEAKDVWVLDSGCTYHMSPNKEWFRNLQTQVGGSVLLGNDDSCKVKGIGNIRIKLQNGSIRCITNVRYIPELKRNLISLGTLESQGYTFKYENGVLVVSKGSKVILEGDRHNGLYFLNATTLVGVVNVIDMDKMASLWHLRLGHVSEKRLTEFNKKGCFGE